VDPGGPARFFTDHGVDPRGVVRALLGGVEGSEDGGATLDQQLAKLLYTPERTDAGAYDPLTHLDLAKQRQRDVLDRLVDTGVFSRAQADAAFAAPLRLPVPQA
jgi:membrane peptidoglycan carboxypeptidase